MKEDCIFCKIAGKEADATVVYEDSHTLAFLDIHPLNPGHTLVIPKKHYANMLEMPSEEAGRVFASVHKVMKGVQKASGADGISVGQSNGNRHTAPSWMRLVRRSSRLSGYDGICRIFNCREKGSYLWQMDHY